ncbi:MAG: TldD/PmbA family protein, partial [Chloroflexi bacterium]|nr:TldD/PmbA family protein [Chloroflexota bacterium]
MIGVEMLRSAIDQALAYSKADQTEVMVTAVETALTRFAENTIHQNVAESNASLNVRVVYGKRIGVASLNDLSRDGIRRAVDAATTIARNQMEDPDFVSLPRPRPVRRLDAFVQRTADHGPAERAADVAVICRRAAEQDCVASGALQITVSERAIANSLGIFAYHADTLADLTTVVMANSGSGSGYADRFALDIAEIDAEAVAAEAIGKALRSRNPGELPPGEYPVILEEYAVSDILDFLAYLGFSAKAVQERRSFLAGRLGERIVGSNVTIWDDGLDPQTVPMPFDYEGVGKQCVDLVVDGVARGIVYDSMTAHREGRESTGHGLPAGETFGAIPMNQFLKPGEATREDLLRGIDRGVWVTRFHYTRPVHPLKVVVTGMTRDGTFLIERGEIGRPVKNVRFTQSYLDALNNVTAIGRQTRLERDFFPFNRVPMLKVANWTFQGSTADV